MCPVCMATTAALIASAVSSGGVAAVVVNKLRAKRITRRMLWKTNQKEEPWAKQRTSRQA